MDWNNLRTNKCLWAISHFPCGSVDWNSPLGNPDKRGKVTSLAEVWIETNKSRWIWKSELVTSLAEVWIETGSESRTYATGSCHFPCGSVDWNFYHRWYRSGQWVTSLAEVWIETSLCCISLCNHPVTSLAEVWIETKVDWEVQNEITSHFPCGSVDWNII